MKNRVCVFSFYNHYGHVEKYVIYLLQELSSVCRRIIFVVNGIITDKCKEEVKKYVDDIVIRPNCGYDAGAYKQILVEKLADQLERYDELVLCNDTFWGPFIPFSNIFEEMELKECDYWGFCNCINNYCDYILSFFLVCRGRIIKTSILQDYFSSYVDDKATDIHYAYCQFETGLYDFLITNGYIPGIYSNIDNLNVYKETDVLLYKYKFPLMKRKAFSKEYFNKQKIEACLTYLNRYTEYDVNYILEDVANNYKMPTTEFSVRTSFVDYGKYAKCFESRHSENQLREFLNCSEPLYVYGAGVIACRFYWKYLRNKENFLGFVVSDGQMIDQHTFMDRPLYHLSEIVIENKTVIVAIEKFESVIENIKRSNYILI